MKRKVNKRILNNVLRLINEIPYVNYGGCGIVAENLADRLSKYGKTRLLCLTRNPLGVKEGINYNIRNRGKSLIGKDHIIIEFKESLFVDSTGIYDDLTEVPMYDNRVPISLPKTLLRRLNKVPSEWNDSFSRRNIKKIKQLCKNL